jgi:hypothetical protein
MIEPVTLADGITYEFAAIQAWAKMGIPVSPVTGKI